jgi:protein CpxP
MIILRVGLILLAAAAIGFGQQPGPVPPQPNPPGARAIAPSNVTLPEFRRFESIIAKRNRGEGISPEERRFAREFIARINNVLAPSAPPQTAPQGSRMGANQAPRPAAAAQRLQAARPSLERALSIPRGRWWARPEMVEKLALTPEQTKEMDEILQQYRLKLIDSNASLRKEETIMDPLIEAEEPDEAKIVAQIDRVVKARAELEKTNARMLLGIRRLLTPEQWNTLKAEAPAAPQPDRR